MLIANRLTKVVMFNGNFYKKYNNFLFFFLLTTINLQAQKVILSGRVLEINSGKKPISLVQIKSDDGANSVLSNNNGSYLLTFQDQISGTLVYIEAQKEGYELVNKKEMQLFLPDASQDQKMQLEIILCKKGYLDQAKIKYYEITEKYIKKEFKKRYNHIIAKKKDGWQKERSQLEIKMELLKEQLEKQAEEYIRTNRDNLSKKELKALKLFQEGKVDESLRMRASLNSEEELKKELNNQKLAKENIIKAKQESRKASNAIEMHRRNLKAQADGFILKFEFDKAEKKLRFLAEIDSNNFKSNFYLAHFLGTQNKDMEAIKFYKKALRLNTNKFNEASILNNLGVLYLNTNKIDEALTSFNTSLMKYLILARYDSIIYKPVVASLNNNLGLYYTDIRENYIALTYLKEALRIRLSLAKKEPEKYSLDLVDTYKNIGTLYARGYKYQEALTNYKTAIRIIKLSKKNDEAKYQSMLAYVFNNLGVLNRNYKKYKEAISNFNEALDIRKRLAEKNPEKQLSEIALLQNNIGMLHFNNQDYKEALSNFESALKTSLYLVKIGPERYADLLGRTRNNLGSTYLNIKDYENSLSNHTEALKIYKSLSEESPEKYEVDLARTIILLGLLQKTNGKGNRVNNIYIDIEKAKRIVLENIDLPKTDKLVPVVEDLIIYFNSYSLIEQIDLLRGKLVKAQGEDRINIIKKIISKLTYLQSKGYDVITVIGTSKGSLAFYKLFAKDFKGAEQSAKEALNPKFEKPKDYDASMEWVNTNLALAYLYQDKYEQAKVIYLKLKDKPRGNQTYKEVFLKDLDALEKEGITHPDVVKIRSLLQEK